MQCEGWQGMCCLVVNCAVGACLKCRGYAVVVDVLDCGVGRVCVSCSKGLGTHVQVCTSRGKRPGTQVCQCTSGVDLARQAAGVWICVTVVMRYCCVCVCVCKNASM